MIFEKLSGWNCKSVLYNGATSWMLAKVPSWWGSRLGGSAPMTASRTPPRRGVSAAWTAAAVATTAEATRRARATTGNSALRRWNPVAIMTPPSDVERRTVTGRRALSSSDLPDASRLRQVFDGCQALDLPSLLSQPGLEVLLL